MSVPPPHRHQLPVQTSGGGPLGGERDHARPGGHVPFQVRQGAGKDGVFHAVDEQSVPAHGGRRSHDGLGKRHHGGPLHGDGVHDFHRGEVGTVPPSHNHQDATPTGHGGFQTAGSHAWELLHPSVLHVAVERAGFLVAPVLPPDPRQQAVHHHQGEVLVGVSGHGGPGVCGGVVHVDLLRPPG